MITNGGNFTMVLVVVIITIMQHHRKLFGESQKMVILSHWQNSRYSDISFPSYAMFDTVFA